MSYDNRDQYWASLPQEELADELMCRVHDYYSQMVRRGFWDQVRRSYRAYYGLADDGTHETSAVTFVGERGEVSYLSVANYRSFVRRILTLATANRPAFEPRPVNTDVKSTAQVEVARTVLEYYMREKRLDRVWKEAVECSLVMSVSYAWTIWDERAGAVVRQEPMTDKNGQPVFETDDDGQVVMRENPDTGLPEPVPVMLDIHEGDVVAEMLTLMDVVCDMRRRGKSHDWRMVRRFVNRWDLAADYPELRDKIMDLECERDDFAYSLIDFGYDTERDNSDDVVVWYFFHRKSPALPEGRLTVMAGRDLVLMDGPLPYKDIPVYRTTSAEMLGTGYSYADAWDLLGLCEAHSSVMSTALTNNDAFGIANVVAPIGVDIDERDIGSGMRLIKYPVGSQPPEVMVMQAIPDSTFKLAEAIEAAGEKISGINSTMRGDPQSNVKSGTFAALMVQQAMQYNSGPIANALELAQDIGTGVLRILQSFASEPRIVSIAGKDSAFEVTQFVGDDVSLIDRVSIEISNPFTRTNEGRVALAEKFFEGRPEEFTISDFVEFMETGQIIQKLKRPITKRQLIKAQNELLREGPPVTTELDPKTGQPIERLMQPELRVLATDDHPLFIQEALSILDDVGVRGEEAVVKAVFAKVQEHFRVWRSAPPDVLAVAGVAPPPPPPGMQAIQAPLGDGMTPEGQPAPRGKPTGKMQGAQGQPLGGVQPPNPAQTPV